MSCGAYKKIFRAVVLSVFAVPILTLSALSQVDLYARLVIRGRFQASKDSAAAVNKLMEDLDAVTMETSGGMPDHVFAYHAALRGLQAKYEENLVKKLDYLMEAIRQLDEAVERAPDDLDVRFVRFASYQSFPNVLGIGKKRGQDVDALVMLLKKWDNQTKDRDFLRHIYEALLDSDRLNSEQQGLIQTLLIKLED